MKQIMIRQVVWCGIGGVSGLVAVHFGVPLWLYIVGLVICLSGVEYVAGIAEQQEPVKSMQDAAKETVAEVLRQMEARSSSSAPSATSERPGDRP